MLVLAVVREGRSGRPRPRGGVRAWPGGRRDESEASGGRTVVAVGSPDENAVYLLWISANGACEVKKEPVDSSLHIRGVCTKHMTSFFSVDRTQSGLFILILLFQAQIEMVPPRSSTYGQFGASVAFARNFLFVGQPGCKT